MEVLNRIDQKDAIAFMKGGKAKFLLHTLKSDKQFRYRIKKKEYTDPVPKNLYWVYIETSVSIYIGYFDEAGDTYIRNNDQWEKATQQGAELFIYLMRKLKSLEVPEQLHILHLGFCGVCGRKLKDAHSISIGIGPECLKRIS